MRSRGVPSTPAALLRIALALSLLAVSAVPAAAADPPAAPRYLPVIEPGDQIKVNVIGYKDLEETYSVDLQGNVNMAVAGTVAVAGLPGEEVVVRVRDAYWKQLATHPQVLVEPRYRVGVLGQVVKPGLLYVNGTETFTDLLAMAGGPGINANLGGARIARQGETVDADIDASLTQGKSLLEYGVRSGDILFVPQNSAWSDWRMWTAVVSSGLLVLNLLDRR